MKKLKQENKMNIKIPELIVDFYECNDILNNMEYLQESCNLAAKSVNATIVDQLIHSYNPIGISIFLLLAESHIYLATWPEYDYATINIFLCNQNMDPEIALSILKEKLKPKRIKKRYFIHRIKT